MNPVLNLRESYLRGKYSVARILLPTGGLLSGVSRLEGEHTAPDFDIVGMVFGARRFHEETQTSTPSSESGLPKYLPHS